MIRVSIVENAIKRAAENKRVERERDAETLIGAAPDGDRSESASGEVVEVRDVESRGMVSVLEHAELSKAFRFLKRSILAKVFGSSRNDAERGKTIIVTSAMPGAGKSFMAFNLAVSIAREQLVNVVLIDADVVRQNLTSLLKLTEADGLLDILVSRKIDNGVMSTELPGLRFIPSGHRRDDGTELLASNYMAQVLGALGDPDTVVVIDTTPLLVSSEADAVSAHADHILIVVEAGGTSSEELEKVLQMVNKYDASVSFVMNKLSTHGSQSDAEHYSYSY